MTTAFVASRFLRASCSRAGVGVGAPSLRPKELLPLTRKSSRYFRVSATVGLEGSAGDVGAEIETAGEPVEECLQAAHELGFGFSAGGMLFPYLIGVVKQLNEEGVMTDRTKVAGSSAGAIVAVSSASGHSMDYVLEACLELAHDYRSFGTRGRMGTQLQDCLAKFLPDDIHERCNDTAYIGVTKLLPYPRHELLHSYESKEDVLKAVLTSCHIPWYFNGAFCTTFRGALYYDGGLTDLIPVPLGVKTAVKVSCFPSKRLKRVTNIAVSPDSFDEDYPHNMSQLISWAFEPAEEHMLVEMYERGQRDAGAWVTAHCPPKWSRV
eukprot:CAMPEP_0177775074 /NCGR_PEP_ID=MMETSP0491_2-20121128/13883_1 /TAXON_ID=63592 /ORGANISM="Tetraselmis chuii, Strain PLY429" /LENGTH=322 /DNA_ID=CAMNT_0019293569 /DNA_START=50 /DNA_END=1018 /DNA_ORIENTATION=+